MDLINDWQFRRFKSRFIILAERIEGCVAADGSGRGSLSPEELREIFVVNR